MSFTELEKEGLLNAVESLKKYRRADLIDDKGRNLLEALYTDLLPSNYILKKTLQDNTTFLIGRKGTGKSTIFLMVEQQIRKKKGYLPCYLDVKTMYESSYSKVIKLEYLDNLMPKEILEKYLIERAFIQSVLSAIQKELSQKANNLFTNIMKVYTTAKKEMIKGKMENLKKKIENNEVIKEIEIPTVKEMLVNQKNTDSTSTKKENKLGGLEATLKMGQDGVGGSIKTDTGMSSGRVEGKSSEIEQQFSNVFLKVFQITDVIATIRDILREIGIKHLVVLLDDYSEIDDKAIRTFVDVILAPLNNWSEEFIKFKIAAYPGRVYYGKIDPGKIDEINLDFYNLYSTFDRNKMEENAIDFTKRILEKRIKHFTKKEPKYFFDTDKYKVEEYYELLFYASMNVPRIMGYILSYCYQNKIILDKPILKSDIESAAQMYYQEKVYPFFDNTTHSLISTDERISILQLKELLNNMINVLDTVRKNIISGQLKGSNYNPKQPYASHFYFDPRLEEFVKTLELNFFISKYNSLSDRDGNPSSIYCINYGLARKNNLLWGKPVGAEFRKYFIQRPFDFNKVIREFLRETQKIQCTNCEKNFALEDLTMLEAYKFRCNECGGFVKVEHILDKVKDKLDSIDKNKLLPLPEVYILGELKSKTDSVFAREIAEELDYSSQLVAWRCKKLDEELGLVKRDKDGYLYKYKLTDKAKSDYC